MATAKISKNYSTSFDATIELLNRDAGKSTTAGIRNVIDWINSLSVEGLLPIAEELEHLEDFLSEPSPDGPKIAGSLEKLSAMASQAASLEGAAQGEKVKELAQTLSRAAKMLRKG